MGDIRMPAIGDLDSAVLVQWRVAPGDRVRRTEAVAYVETSKGVIEVESFEDGVVDDLLAQPGDTVAVGSPLARLRAA